MFYERGDHTMTMEYVFPKPYAMVTDPIIDPPSGTIDDWRFFFELAKVMAVPLKVAGRELDPEAPPTSQQLLEWSAGRGRVPFDTVAAAPHGLLAQPRQATVAQATAEGGQYRLDLFPQDVAQELQSAIARPSPKPGELRLVVRRMRGLMNTLRARIFRHAS
jgi:anaerobic selenocysteine-containing dehydrogenase